MLALFGLAVGLVVWWSQSGRGADPEPTPTPGPDPLWRLTPQDVLEISIEGVEQGTTIRARREEEQGWVLLEPQDEGLQANAGRIERAVTALVVLRPVEVLDDVSLTEYGLEDPLYRVTLVLQDGSSRSLLIGRQAPTGDVSYARRPDDASTVYLLQSFAVQEVTGLITVPPVITPAVGGATPATPAPE